MNSPENNEQSGQHKATCDTSNNTTGNCCQGGSCCSPLQSIDWGYLSDRVKAVISDPKNIWTTIKGEEKTIKSIYLSYLIPLAAIGAICGLLGQLFFIGSAGIFSSFIFAAVMLAVTLAMILVNAYVYKTLAGHFGGATDETNSFKLLAYSSTASMIGKFLSIFPPLSIVSIFFSIYSLYTLYQGVPTMTGVNEKRLPYFVTCFIACFLINLIVGGIVLGSLGLGAIGTVITTKGLAS